jgi:hypothetical protein
MASGEAGVVLDETPVSSNRRGYRPFLIQCQCRIKALALLCRHAIVRV